MPERTSRFAVVGDPIDHSLSPTMHRAGYAACGIGATYEAIRVPAGNLVAVLAERDDLTGVSVTAPLKAEALALATDRTRIAEKAAAANTLLRTADGWEADNTDVFGAIGALGETGVTLSRAHAVILGAGATARSVGIALGLEGVRSVTLVVRDESRAAETARVLSDFVDVRVVSSGAAGEVEPVAVAVSTIPASAQQALTPGISGLVASADVFFDVVYDPWPTPLAAAAAEIGQRAVSGIDLLAHQAVAQFEMFTGAAVSPDVLRDAALAELAAR